MKKSRIKDEQIIKVLKEAEASIPISDLCRKCGVSDATFYNWRKKYGSLEVNEARRLKQLEDENHHLKNLLADTMLEKEAIQAELEKSGEVRSQMGTRIVLERSA